MSEIIQITPTARLRVETDPYPECPRGDWHMLTGFVNFPRRGDLNRMDVPAVHEAPIPIDLVQDKFYGDTALGWEETTERTIRWARIFHGLHIEWDAEHGGFWFVAGADAETRATPVDSSSRCLFHDNWPDSVLGTPEDLARQAKIIEEDRETYRRWADGEVDRVIFERAETLAPVVWDASSEVWDLINPLTDDDIRQEWDEEDSIWGNYLDEEYTAVDVALEHFDLTQEEQAAALLLFPAAKREAILAHRKEVAALNAKVVAS